MLYRSDVCTKYQEAAKIVNLTVEGLITQCVVGAKVLDLCEFGSKVMEAAAAKLYTKKVNGKSIDRGIAFPVCISVNDMVCNFSPLETEETVSSRSYCPRCLSLLSRVLLVVLLIALLLV
jgi:methionine aminopeptidase